MRALHLPALRFILHHVLPMRILSRLRNRRIRALIPFSLIVYFRPLRTRHLLPRNLKTNIPDKEKHGFNYLKKCKQKP